MTEYDYSPDAYDRYMEKLDNIRSWSTHVRPGLDPKYRDPEPVSRPRTAPPIEQPPALYPYMPPPPQPQQVYYPHQPLTQAQYSHPNLVRKNTTATATTSGSSKKSPTPKRHTRSASASTVTLVPMGMPVPPLPPLPVQQVHPPQMSPPRAPVRSSTAPAAAGNTNGFQGHRQQPSTTAAYHTAAQYPPGPFPPDVLAWNQWLAQSQQNQQQQQQQQQQHRRLTQPTPPNSGPSPPPTGFIPPMPYPSPSPELSFAQKLARKLGTVIKRSGSPAPSSTRERYSSDHTTNTTMTTATTNTRETKEIRSKSPLRSERRRRRDTLH